MKRRTKRKILKRWEKQHCIKPNYFEIVGRRAKTILRNLDKQLNDAVDYYYARQH